TTMMIMPITPHLPPFFGEGCTGLVGEVSPMIRVGSYGVNVDALCAERITPAGMMRLWPSISAALPESPFASASLNQSEESPQRLPAIDASVSPWRTTYWPPAALPTV